MHVLNQTPAQIVLFHFSFFLSLEIVLVREKTKRAPFAASSQIICTYFQIVPEIIAKSHVKEKRLLSSVLKGQTGGFNT